MALKFKYNDLNKGKKEPGNENDAPEEKTIERYNTEGSTRTLCFIQADDKSIFLNYSYLVSGEFDPNESAIKLTYTSHLITIKGSNLDSLYEEIMYQIARIISVTDKRYAETVDGEKPVITEVSIVKNAN